MSRTELVHNLEPDFSLPEKKAALESYPRRYYILRGTSLEAEFVDLKAEA